MFGIGMKELIVILLVVGLVFGYKKLPEIGSSLGKAIRGFKKTLSEDEPEEIKPAQQPSNQPDEQNRNQNAGQVPGQPSAQQGQSDCSCSSQPNEAENDKK